MEITKERDIKEELLKGIADSGLREFGGKVAVFIETLTENHYDYCAGSEGEAGSDISGMRQAIADCYDALNSNRKISASIILNRAVQLSFSDTALGYSVSTSIFDLQQQFEEDCKRS